MILLVHRDVQTAIRLAEALGLSPKECLCIGWGANHMATRYSKVIVLGEPIGTLQPRAELERYVRSVLMTAVEPGGQLIDLR